MENGILETAWKCDVFVDLRMRFNEIGVIWRHEDIYYKLCTK